MGMCLLNFGLFIKPMGDDLGISRAVFGWAQTVRQLCAAVTSPLLGRWVDRFGSRGLLPGAVTLTGLAMISFSQIESEAGLLLTIAVVGIAGYAVPGGILTNVPVMKWFEHKRGRAMGIVSAITLIGGMVFLPLTQELIDRVGWRNAWVYLAVIGTLLVVPISLIFLRRAPEDFGLLPDGQKPSADQLEFEQSVHHYALREASRTRAFWLLAVLFTLMSLSISTIGLHRIPAFMDRGLSPMWVAWATALDSALAGVASIVTGFLANRVGIARLGSIGFALLALACWLTIIATTIPLMLASMGLFGVGIGMVMQTQNLIWPAFFGRKHIGSIRGAVMPITLVFSAIGAPFAGYIYDTTGSYDSVWWGAVTIMLIGALLALVARKPD